MTLEITGVDIIEDLIASGSWADGEVSACDYGVLDSGCLCPIVAQPGNSTGAFSTYGWTEYDWGIRLECYIKEMPDIEATLMRVWRIHDVVASAIHSGTNVNDAYRKAVCRAFQRAPNTFVLSDSGQPYLPVIINVGVREEDTR